MNQPLDWNGRVLDAALQEQPSLVLSFLLKMGSEWFICLMFQAHFIKPQ